MRCVAVLAFANRYTAALAVLCVYNMAPAAGIDILGPAGSETFGTQLKALQNGNIVVTDPLHDLSGPNVADVGAVYLYSPSGNLISKLTGSSSSDRIGTDILVLANGNFVVLSPFWNSSRGAVTWASGKTGVAGVVTVSNSLIGTTINDRIGTSGFVLALQNGNFVACSPDWDDVGLANIDAGAATWGNGAIGTFGTITASNSLIGSSPGDRTCTNLRRLQNSNYLISSPGWDAVSPPAIDAGALTWGNGNSGTSGYLSPLNSIVGTSEGDSVGIALTLSNGNYVASTPSWDSTNPIIANVGAATWGNGHIGTSGAISSSNSVIGRSANDFIETGGTVGNSNYIVKSASWDADSPPRADAGAIMWADGNGGTTGIMNQTNSLVGRSTNDRIGQSVFILLNGHAVIISPQFDGVNPAQSDIGAATWMHGNQPTTGEVSAANSLVGSSVGDRVGEGNRLIVLSNGNYVIGTTNFDSTGPVIADVGAVTWGNGSTGSSGRVSINNSLIGSSSADSVGGRGIIALSNGNYAFSSPNWDSANLGAVTWGNGATGSAGVVSAANSVIGRAASDAVGSGCLVALSNGNYVTCSPEWDKRSTEPGGVRNDAGAVTWGNGLVGAVGTVSVANSLYGGSANDRVGSLGVRSLPNGSYVVSSPDWDSSAPALIDAGAVTWLSGNSEHSTLVTSSNSLVGSSSNDRIGETSVSMLSSGDYAVSSPNWDSISPVRSNVGAATLGSMTMGVSGTVTASNSLIGSSLNDRIQLFDPGNNKIFVGSATWDSTSPPMSDVGAFTTIGSGAFGVIGQSNSIVGTTQNGGNTLVVLVDDIGNRLIVGRPRDNIVSILGTFSDVVFANSFE